MKKVIAIAVSIAVLATASFAGAQVVQQRFSDVPENHWAYDSVEWAASSGITKGTGDGKFSPKRTLTRAEIVTFLERYNRLVVDPRINSFEGTLDAGIASRTQSLEDRIEALESDKPVEATTFVVSATVDLSGEGSRVATAYLPEGTHVLTFEFAGSESGRIVVKGYDDETQALFVNKTGSSLIADKVVRVKADGGYPIFKPGPVLFEIDVPAKTQWAITSADVESSLPIPTTTTVPVTTTTTVPPQLPAAPCLLYTSPSPRDS